LPDRSSELKAVADEARAFFVQKHAARERALRLSRTVTQLSATTIRSAHRGEYDEARELLSSARGLVAEMKEIQESHPDVYYTGFVQDAQKEYVEANSTLAFIIGAPLPTPEELSISHAPYLNGLGEAIGEMRRYLLDSLRRGDPSRCEDLLDLMDHIYTELFTMDFPEAITGGLRRTTDAMRGLLERTRGDLTTALRQQSLEQRLNQLWEHLKTEERKSAID
jgi:translin